MQDMTVHVGGPLHVVDHGGTGRPLVLVHGLGGHHANWMDVAPGLTAHGRVLALDLPGFGFSPPQERSRSVLAIRNVLLRYLDEVVDEPAVLIGNSLGGLLSVLAAARAPHLVDRLVLVCPALPARRAVRKVEPIVAVTFLIYLVPGLAERYVQRRRDRLGPERLSREILRLCTVDPDRVSKRALERHVDIARERASLAWGTETFVEAARTMVWLLMQRRKMREVIDAVTSPTLVVHGAQDRLVPLADVRAIAGGQRPDWQLEIFDDVGHVPELEVPDRFVEVVGRWLEHPAPRAVLD